MEETALEYPTGSSVVYSDLGFHLLGKLIETVAGEDLDASPRARSGPAGRDDTTPDPTPSLVPRCAATGPRLVEPPAGPPARLGAGRPGLEGRGHHRLDGAFTTARDVATFSQMILNGGSYGHARSCTHPCWSHQWSPTRRRR